MTSSIGSIGGGMSATALKQMQEQMFKTADINGDNSISKDELSQISKSDSNQNSSNIDEMFSQLDSNSDGAISRLESDAALAKAGQGMEAQGAPPTGSPPPPPQKDTNSSSDTSAAAALYDAMDTNEDGVVSPSELAAALEKSQKSSTAASDPKNLLANLGSALQSGNTSDAQSAIATLQNDVSSHNGGQSNDPFSKDLQSLSDALQSGNLSGAQSIFAGIQEKLSAGPPDKPAMDGMQSKDGDSQDSMIKTLQAMLDDKGNSSSASAESKNDTLKSILTSALTSYLQQSFSGSTQDSAISSALSSSV
jgi:Ca2+-binding EF-hand superfamily protein